MLIIPHFFDCNYKVIIDQCMDIKVISVYVFIRSVSVRAARISVYSHDICGCATRMRHIHACMSDTLYTIYSCRVISQLGGVVNGPRGVNIKRLLNSGLTLCRVRFDLACSIKKLRD